MQKIAVLAVLLASSVPAVAVTDTKANQEFAWISNNQDAVRKRLRDPGSAQFGSDYVSYKIGAPIVCGTVNSKNGFGGYTGAKRYISAGSVGTFLEEDVVDFENLWAKTC